MRRAVPGRLAAELAGPPRVLTLREWAEVTGGLRHVELTLFGRLGRLAVAAPLPSLAGWAMGASLMAAWRAEQLEVLLPVSTGLPDRGSVTRPRSPEVASALDRLVSLGAVALAREVSERWFPALLRAYETRSAHCFEPADAPFGAVLARLVADVADASRRASDLLVRDDVTREDP